MKLLEVRGKAALNEFYNITKTIYKDNPFYRTTNEEVVKHLTAGSTVFKNHATVIPYIIKKGDETVGRLALIHDAYLKDYVQIAFFEALPGLENLAELISEKAAARFKECSKIVVGINGHLNYGAGILLNHFDEQPVFELPYNPDYYPDYFKKFHKREIVSFRFETAPFHEYFENFENSVWNGITVRFMDKRKFKKEIKTYTELNNACFHSHPFWAKRDINEDLEMFYPFRHFLSNENLIFAEYKGKPIGFVLWFPDFNQIVSNKGTLGLKERLKFRLGNPIKTFRFYEIAVLPQYQISKASFAMIYKMAKAVKAKGYEIGEGGFIFQENTRSITLAVRYLHRAFGEKMDAYRRFAVYERELQNR